MQLLGIHNFGAVFGKLLGAVLVDFCHIGAGNIVFTALRQYHIGTGGGGVHRHTGGVFVAAFIDIVEDHGRCHGAGDIGIVQNQGDHSIGIVLGIFSKIHRHLSLRQGAGQKIGAGFCDMHHGVGVGFGGFVGIFFGAFAKSEVLVCGIINNVIGGVNSAFGVTVCGDTVIGQGDAHRLFRSGLSGRCFGFFAAGQHTQRQ